MIVIKTKWVKKPFFSLREVCRKCVGGEELSLKSAQTWHRQSIFKYIIQALEHLDQGISNEIVFNEKSNWRHGWL